MNKLVIRKMTSEDLVEVQRLLYQLDGVFASGHDISLHAVKTIFSEMEEKKDVYINYIAAYEDTIVGFVSAVTHKTFFHKGGTLLINELIIDEHRRGRGIGEKLVHTMIGIARGAGLNEVEVSTSSGNEKAISFYKKNGLIDESILLGMELNK
jgi:ribosomal protein S18 acetylase RimI-like enzyme